MDYQITHPVRPPLGSLCQLCTILLERLFRSFSIDSHALGMFETVIQTRNVEDLRPASCRLCAFAQYHINSLNQQGGSNRPEPNLSVEICPSIPVNGHFQLQFRGIQGGTNFDLALSSPGGSCAFLSRDVCR